MVHSAARSNKGRPVAAGSSIHPIKSNAMNPILLNLAVKAALQAASFPQIVISQMGSPFEREAPGEQMEDSLGGYTIKTLVIPVLVMDSSITIDPLADTMIDPTVTGEVVINLENDEKPFVKYDIAKLVAATAAFLSA